MKEAPHDGATSGEIVVRAPWLTNGYFNSPDASEQLWASGYLHTSDIGVITPDGDLQVTDRIKDVIKTGGEWISSLQLEDIIMHRVGVAECAVIGVKDARWGERPLALIVRDPKTTPPVSEEDIKAHVLSYSEKGMISKFAVPQKILFVEALGQDKRRQVRQESAARAIRRRGVTRGGFRVLDRDKARFRRRRISMGDRSEAGEPEPDSLFRRGGAQHAGAEPSHRSARK